MPTEIDSLDAAIARLEGPAVAVVDAAGKAWRPDGTPYQPTRQREEAARLLDKYVSRLIKLPLGWAAVDGEGRAHVGVTSLIAICKAVASLDATAARAS